MVARQVKKELNKRTEKKYHQEIDLNESISNQGLIVDISPIPQGVLATQRVGNKVRPTSLFHRGMIRGEDNVNFVRQVVIQWYEDSYESVPSLSKIFENTNGTQQKLYTIFNRQLLGKSFRVLSDKIYNMTHAPANPEFNRYKLFRLNLQHRIVTGKHSV